MSIRACHVCQGTPPDVRPSSPPFAHTEQTGCWSTKAGTSTCSRPAVCTKSTCTTRQGRTTRRRGAARAKGRHAPMLPRKFLVDLPLLSWNFSIRKDSEKVDSSDSSHVIRYLSCQSVVRDHSIYLLSFDTSHVTAQGWTNRTLAVHERMGVHFLVLPGSLLSIIEITEYRYCSSLKPIHELRYKSE